MANLRSSPFLGHPIAEFDARKYSIPRTPFSFIYRITDNQIDVLRVLDGRSDADSDAPPTEI